MVFNGERREERTPLFMLSFFVRFERDAVEDVRVILRSWWTEGVCWRVGSDAIQLIYGSGGRRDFLLRKAFCLGC